MAYSSDEIIKREILDTLGHETKGIKLRIFPQSSNEDQKPFSEGGLTFGFEGVSYGSCDAAWYVDDDGIGRGRRRALEPAGRAEPTPRCPTWLRWRSTPR
jgi:hypothetical protein